MGRAVPIDQAIPARPLGDKAIPARELPEPGVSKGPPGPLATPSCLCAQYEGMFQISRVTIGFDLYLYLSDITLFKLEVHERIELYSTLYVTASKCLHDCDLFFKGKGSKALMTFKLLVTLSPRGFFLFLFLFCLDNLSTSTFQKGQELKAPFSIQCLVCLFFQSTMQTNEAEEKSFKAKRFSPFPLN